MPSCLIAWSLCFLLMLAGVLPVALSAGEVSAVPHVSDVTTEVIVSPDAVRVHVRLTIANPLTDEREHLVDLILPEAAAVDRFGMWVQGRFLEGEIAPRALGRRLYQQVSGLDDTRMKRDPALLTWESPGHYRLRVFPVLAHGELRVLLSYVVSRLPDQPLVLPSVLAVDARRASTVIDSARTIPAVTLPTTGQPLVRACAGPAGQPGFFVAMLPLPAWSGKPQVPDLEIIVRDTSRRMRGRYASGSPLQRELAQRITANHPCFLLDADVVPQPIIPLDATMAAKDPTCGGLFDLAGAWAMVGEFLATHPAKNIRLTMLGDAEADCGPALFAPVPLPQVTDGSVTLSCANDPRWLVAVEAALIDDRDLTALHLTGADGLSDVGPAWLARAPLGGHLLVFGRFERAQGALHLTARAPDGSIIDHIYVLAFQADAEATHLPRLWAAQRLRDLARSGYLDPPAAKNLAKDNERQQQDLSRTYQVLGPAASFVVLSNERDYRANDLERATRIVGWAEAATTSLVAEPAADAWQSNQGMGSRFGPPAPEPAGVSLSKVWGAVSADLDLFEAWNRSYPALQRESDGRWERDRYLGELTVPPAGWAPRMSEPDLAAIPSAVTALWGERVAPVVCTIDGQRWCWWRDGDQAVLQHLAADGHPDWWVVIDHTGVRTARPEWGVWWRHHPGGVPTSRLLDISPSPTWLPLSWLSRHVRIGSEVRDGATLVTMVPLARTLADDEAPIVASHGILFPAVGGLPRVHWSSGVGWGARVITFRSDGEEVIARADDGRERRMLLRPAPDIDRNLPFGDDQMTVGILDAAPLWRNLRAGTATAGDCWQMALTAEIPGEALPWLERAHALDQQNAGIALHLAAVLKICGHQERSRALLTSIDGLILPAWQRSGFATLRKLMADPQPIPGPASGVFVVTPPGKSQSWPMLSQFDPEYVIAPDLKNQVQEALRTVQPERLAILARQAHWNGLPGLSASAQAPTLMAALFGSDAASPQWSTAATQELFSHLERDALGRFIINQSLRKSPFIAAYLMQALRDPARRDLARAALLPSYESWHANDEAWRQCLLKLGADPYPLAVQVLAHACLLRDARWSITDRPGLGAGIRARLAAIPQADVRLGVMGDCLELLGEEKEQSTSVPGSNPLPTAHMTVRGLFDTAPATWDTLLATHAAISDPVAYTVTQPELERALGRVLLAVIVTHHPADIMALMERLQRLPASGVLQPAFGSLRPLAVQLCRQAAAVGLRVAAVTTAHAIFAAAPEPGLIAALEQASVRELALMPFPNSNSIAINETSDSSSAPAQWWPEWREDAAALARRCRTQGDQKPDERVLHAVQQRGLGRAVAAAVASDFAEHGPDLHWVALVSPSDPATARQSLAALRAVRQTIQAPTYAALAAFRLTLINGLTAEAAHEIVNLRAVSPGDRSLMPLHLAAAALDGDGSSALDVAHDWLAKRLVTEDAGSVYARIVDILSVTRRFQDAFTIRQEALAFWEHEHAGKVLADFMASGWPWLFNPEHPLLNQVVVPPGTVLFPRTKADPAQQQLAAQAALSRYPAIAAEATAGFVSANDAQRFAWFAALWVKEDQRLGADCPPLVAWVRELVAKRAPLPGAVCEKILQLVQPTSASVWVDYVRQAQTRGDAEVVPHLLWRARQEVSRTREAVVLLAIVELDGTPLPDHEGWIWQVQDPPPGFDDRLTDVAVARARRSLLGDSSSNLSVSTSEDHRWVEGHPACRARIDALVDALLTEHPDDIALLARCAALGWGTQPPATLFRRLLRDPLASVQASSDYQLAELVRDGCIRSLVQEERWADLAGLLRVYQRAMVAFTWPDGVFPRQDLSATAARAGAPEAAATFAALNSDAAWLMAHGHADPTTHPDWWAPDAWTWNLRGDPLRMTAIATQILADPFAQQDIRINAHVWRFAVHLWHCDYRLAAAALAAISDENPRMLAGVRVDTFWAEVGLRLCDDWSTTNAEGDDTAENQGAARGNNFSARRREFLAYCAHAPAAEVPPLALLMGLGARLEHHSVFTPAQLSSVMLDLATVERRCSDQGLVEQVRTWIENGGQLPLPETPIAEIWPALAELWTSHSQVTGRPQWSNWGLGEGEPWQTLPRAQQRDILRHVSELAMHPRADAWWPEIRNWSDFNGLVRDLNEPMPSPDPGQPKDPADPVPHATIIPSPAVWLAHEAWRRSPALPAEQR